MDVVNNYLSWLRVLVDMPSPQHDLFFDVAFDMPFIVDEKRAPEDVNRASDGILLRQRFQSETSIRLPDLGDCSVLEFLTALSDRMNDVTYNYEEPDGAGIYFQYFLNALKIHSKSKEYEIRDALEIMVYRNYDRWGHGGGLFPLNKSVKDQRNVEVWYQMMAYLNEKT